MMFLDSILCNCGRWLKMLSLHLFWSLKSAEHGIKRCEERESREKLETMGRSWSSRGQTRTWVPYCLQFWWCGWSAEESDDFCHRAKHIVGAGHRESEEQLRGLVSQVSQGSVEASRSLRWKSTGCPWIYLKTTRAVWLLLQIRLPKLLQKALLG